MFDVNKLASIKVGLASPEKIRGWSHGEVTKQETINYRSHKPEPDGLFCEKIFGPTKDYTCHCGKLHKAFYKDQVCENCGVQITTKDVRRERMGHINLAAPCSHIWYLKGVPSRMSLLLDLKVKELEEIIIYSSHVVLDPGKSTKLLYKQVIDDINGREIFRDVIEEIRQGLTPNTHEYDRATTLIENLSDPQHSFAYYEYVDFIKYKTDARFGDGARAIKELLQNLDLQALKEEIEKKINDAKKQSQKLTKLVKQLDVVNAFITSGNKPEWMILDVIPVIPPDLRPLLQLDGGRFAASPLNELYKRVIARNNRLKELIEKNSPTIVINNESRMLQDAVDALIDNSKRTNKKATTNQAGVPLKSLSTILKGKQGRFRTNLLGKRVDYSGRSVIAVGPSLKMYQCGLPREMAIALLRPFIASILLRDKKCTRHGEAERKIDARDEDVLKIVEEIISEHPVLLNRAPTLHRLGIQAFQPVLVEGRAIRLHPLVCTGFNADFDGDQMAVHVPIRKEAQEEALHLMLASNNILSPSSGKPIATPSQDMLIGNYYLTTELSKEDLLNRSEYFENAGDHEEALKYKEYAKLEGKVFKDIDECYKAYLNKKIHLNTRVAFLGSAMKKDGFTEEMNNSYIITSVGKMIFNLIFPKDFPYINDGEGDVITRNLKEDLPEYFVPKGTNIPEYIAKQPLRRPVVKSKLGSIIDEVFKRYGTTLTSAILDKIKDNGFRFSTVSGLTISIFDINVLPDKAGLIAEGDAETAKFNHLVQIGQLKQKEKYKKVTAKWHDITTIVEKKVGAHMAKDKFNPLFIMKDSGARGSNSNFLQLMGIRGVMSSTTGDDIEIPIKHCFREGIDIAEFFIGTHGSRKGAADTALKTADSGYLTRRLVDVSQDVIVREEDCHTDHGTIVEAITKVDESGEVKEVVSLKSRLIGRFTCHDVIGKNTHELIIKGNEMITEDIAQKIVDAGNTKVEIRSLFGCQTKDGVCVHCYGKNLATGKLVSKGEAVGIMAAQSIGEPGTQLTMRTFHSGGVSGAQGDITMGLPRVAELFEARKPKGVAKITKIPGVVTNINEKANKVYEITIKNDRTNDERIYVTDANAIPVVKVGDVVEAGDPLVRGSIWLQELLDATDIAHVQKYIAEEVHKIYGTQGISISDKHIEVIIRQMLKKVYVLDKGTTDLVPGMETSLANFTKCNTEILSSGKPDARPAVAKPLIFGITASARDSDSWLSAASFQETTRVLTDAAVKGKVDTLHGLKERVITGRLIPAGRGLLTYDEEKEIVDNFDVLETMREVESHYHNERDKDYEAEERLKKKQALEQEFVDNGVDNI